jgi:signal peptidase I
MNAKQLNRILTCTMYGVAIMAMVFSMTGVAKAEGENLPTGYHDGNMGPFLNAEICSASGWAVDPDNRDRDIEVRILVDGTADENVVATDLASDYGKDMESNEICPNGTCRFTTNLWGLISPGEEHQITVQAYDVETETWVNLIDTPKTLTCWGYPEGFHDGEEGETDDVNGCSASGWASDPDDRDRDLDVQVLADDEFVAFTSANQIREDVGICPGGSCGFNLSLWGLISPYEEHRITAQAYDEETDTWVNLCATEKLLTCNVTDPPEPWFTVFPEQGVVEGWNWPLGAILLLTINGDDFLGKETSIISPWEPDSNATWVWFDFHEAYTVEQGDFVTVSLYGSGMMEQIHYVQNLSVNSVDQVDDTIKGVADPGTEVHVWPYATGEEQLAIAKIQGNAAGKWNADMSGIFDLAPGECGRSEIYDESGNRTAVDWCVPSSRFTVWPEWNYLEGYEWPVRDEVSITVAGKEVCSTEVTPAFPEWDPFNTFFSVNFPESCTLETGDLITLSSEKFSFTHQIQDLTISNVDLEEDTVEGTAVFDPEQYILHTWIHDVDGSYMQMSAEGGTWLADFGSQGFDLRPGMGGRVELVDQASNATTVEWYIPNSHFTVFPEWEWFDGMEWRDGSVEISVVGKDECSTKGESLEGFFNGPFPEECDVVVGDKVIFTDGETTRTHIVENLGITDVDKTGDIVTGTADIGSLVYAWVHEYDGTEMQLMVEDGTWQAYFGSMGIDLVEGICGRAEIRDEDGNATAVDWCVPNPHFTVFPEWEWFDGMEWPDGSVYISVVGKDECNTVGESSEGFFNGPFPKDCDVVVGDKVIFTDEDTERTLTVEDLAVTNVDPDANMVGGTSTPGAQLNVWVHEQDGSEVQPFADGEGNWVANFADADFTLVEGMCGRAEIRDGDGNSTAVDWCVP